jgi:hypothetical protein
MQKSLSELITQGAVPKNTILISVLVDPTVRFPLWQDGDGQDLCPDLHDSIYRQDVLIVPRYGERISYGAQLRELQTRQLCPLAYPTLYSIQQQCRHLGIDMCLIAMGSIRKYGPDSHAPALVVDKDDIWRYRIVDNHQMPSNVWTIVSLSDWWRAAQP